jgi:hypothetical protein
MLLGSVSRATSFILPFRARWRATPGQRDRALRGAFTQGATSPILVE